jgi:FlaG/FlaF family flagellin (archaellin)
VPLIEPRPWDAGAVSPVRRATLAVVVLVAWSVLVAVLVLSFVEGTTETKRLVAMAVAGAGSAPLLAWAMRRP